MVRAVAGKSVVSPRTEFTEKLAAGCGLRLTLSESFLCSKVQNGFSKAGWSLPRANLTRLGQSETRAPHHLGASPCSILKHACLDCLTVNPI